MSLIQGEAISKHYGAHQVFNDLTFRIEHRDRIGLVGTNGAGKTTLLRLLACLEVPTQGRLQHKRGLRIGFLPQDPPTLKDTTLWQAMLQVFQPLQRLEKELATLAEKLATARCGDRVWERYTTLQTRFEAAGGYTYEVRIKTVLSGLGFTSEQYDLPLVHLSGGQQTRILLAQRLLEEPDLLLLDEPTNHLDLAAIEWLENWLESFKGALVVVSHDRYFLDKMSNRIWEIAFATLEIYRGNYSAYLYQREERYKERLRRWQAQQDYIQRTEEFIRRHIAGQRTKEAQGRRTRLERFLKTEAIKRPRQQRHIRIRLTPTLRGGDRVLTTQNLVVGYTRQKPLLQVPDLEVWRGQRVALIGPNGTGKTSLIRTLLGQVDCLEGTIRWGANVQLGYLSQTHAELQQNVTVLDTLRAVRQTMTLEESRSLLGRFLFTGDDVFKTIGELSGGERSRVALACLTVQGSNVLLLDEPTNHLDIPSQEILQGVLEDFAGTGIFVTHDRYLIKALATQMWVVEGGYLQLVDGGWDDFLRWRSEPNQPMGTRNEAAGTANQTRQDNSKYTWDPTRQLKRLQDRQQGLENTIHRLEESLKGMEEALGIAGETRDMMALHRLGQQYKMLQARLDSLWQQWEELTEAMEECRAKPPTTG